MKKDELIAELQVRVAHHLKRSRELYLAVESKKLGDTDAQLAFVVASDHIGRAAAYEECISLLAKLENSEQNTGEIYGSGLQSKSSNRNYS